MATWTARHMTIVNNHGSAWMITYTMYPGERRYHSA